MNTDYIESIAKLNASHQPFALATVVRVNGSASARVGSKAIFSEEGKNLFGYVGGGCAEKFVGEQAVEAMKERQGRIVLADLDDEIFGLGVACGGTMEVFIDPVLPMEHITLPHSPLQKVMAEKLAHDYGLKVFWTSGGEALVSEAALVLGLAKELATIRLKTGSSLRTVKELSVHFVTKSKIRMSRMVSILGTGRIPDALRTHFEFLGFKVEVLTTAESFDKTFENDQVVIVASHGPQDPEFVQKALEAGAGYVAMIGSRKRAEEVLTKLRLSGESSLPLYIPSGLDIDARNPSEIALSVVAEVLVESGAGNWN